MLTTSGEVILIMHQHACHGNKNTIQLSPQIEFYKNKVDDRSIKLGGGQHATTLDKHGILMHIRNTLPHMPLRPCTKNEWEKLPYFIITSDKDCDETSLYCEGQLDTLFRAAVF